MQCGRCRCVVGASCSGAASSPEQRFAGLSSGTSSHRPSRAGAPSIEASAPGSLKAGLVALHTSPFLHGPTRAGQVCRWLRACVSMDVGQATAARIRRRWIDPRLEYVHGCLFIGSRFAPGETTNVLAIARKNTRSLLDATAVAIRVAHMSSVRPASAS